MTIKSTDYEVPYLRKAVCIRFLMNSILEEEKKMERNHKKDPVL